MGRKRRNVMPVSISMDRKLSALIDRYLEKNPGTRSHVVNMALTAYDPLTVFDVYRDYWKCDQRDCRHNNPPGKENCEKCGFQGLWVWEAKMNKRLKDHQI
jgi:hypothetical protein